MIFDRNAEKFIRKLPKKEATLILRKIHSISADPFRYLKKLQDTKLWRLRIGGYRAIIDVIISGNKIIVVRMGKRNNVYD